MSHYIDIHAFSVKVCCLTGIIVGFDPVSYSVFEGGSTVSVCASRLSGIISRELTLTFTPIANSGNASCKSLCTHCIRAMYYIHSFFFQ